MKLRSSSGSRNRLGRVPSNSRFLVVPTISKKAAKGTRYMIHARGLRRTVASRLQHTMSRKAKCAVHSNATEGL